MNKLLRANLSRLLQDKAFRFTAGAMVLYGLAVCAMFYYRMVENKTDIPLDEVLIQGCGLAGMLPLPGLLLAAFTSLFVGTEFSDGTIRNKLIVGHTRTEIYLSGFLACAAAGGIMNLCYLAVTLALGLPLFGYFTGSPMLILTLLADGLLLMFAYAAVFYLISMLLQNKASASVISLLGVVAATMVCFTLIERIHVPEFVEAGQLVDGSMVFEKVPNPRYLGGAARAVCQFFAELFPTGQSLQISAMLAPSLGRLALYSGVIILLCCGAGILLFRRRDLK